MPDGADTGRTGTFEWLIRSVATLLRPLQDGVSPDDFRELLCVETGVLVPEGTLDDPGLRSALDSVAASASELVDRVSALTAALSEDQTDEVAESAADLLQAIMATLAAVPGLVQALQSPAVSFPGLTDEQIRSFTENLVARLLEISRSATWTSISSGGRGSCSWASSIKPWCRPIRRT